MKLLFDQNLSYRLAILLGDLYPGSVHVRELELREAEDLVVWHHARERGLTIVAGFIVPGFRCAPSGLLLLLVIEVVARM